MKHTIIHRCRVIAASDIYTDALRMFADALPTIPRGDYLSIQQLSTIKSDFDAWPIPSGFDGTSIFSRIDGYFVRDISRTA